MTIEIQSEAICEMLRQMGPDPDAAAENLLRLFFLVWVQGRDAGLARAQELVGGKGVKTWLRQNGQRDRGVSLISMGN